VIFLGVVAGGMCDNIDSSLLARASLKRRYPQLVERNVIQTDAAPGALGPYSQAIGVGNMLFMSGQVGLNPTTSVMAGDDIVAQTHQVFANIQAVLKAANSDLAHVVKTTVFLVSMGDFGAMNEAYATYFTSNPPARSTIAVAELPRQARVEIECLVYLD